MEFYHDSSQENSLVYKMRKFDKITSFKEKMQRAKPLKKALSATKDSNLNGIVIHN